MLSILRLLTMNAWACCAQSTSEPYITLKKMYAKEILEILTEEKGNSGTVDECQEISTDPPPKKKAK